MSWLADAPSNPSLLVKRTIDVVVSGSLLVVLSPLLAGVAALELAYHGWPPLFIQCRPGMHGRIFRMLKFRTMTNARSDDGELLADGARITPFGQVLRATSIDELPELWNVLTGDMSLVGPRPLLVRYLDRYDERQRRRHEMPPGITGWAQTNGRNQLDWPERLELDVWYVEHWSLSLDARILARTIETVLRREGVSADGEATMPEFMGT